ncbi:uncharacterized protein LOC128243849 isoform X1 [Mya arenaria]|uniref:uncharacterized protein LOC128243849 isoform X1 n=1 Tax=Mya arenaria TaxID=6604 RepID=UPI0022E65B54|nr:uncharacterized protein LOC128243849 isoform X1 [Mya arenaria]
MRLLRRREFKFFLFVSFVVVLINENLIYKIQSYRWPEFPHITRSLDKEQVALLIADPQLQGWQDEHVFPFGNIARWDIDRYLWKTFSYALEYSKPDIIIFLGDIFDEGSKASDSEYAATLARLRGIFPQTSYIKTIYIPGDNDIGGEGRDFVHAWKSDRYEEHFGNISDVIRFGFVDYAKLNVPSYTMSDKTLKAATEVQERLSAPLRVMLNHHLVTVEAKHYIYPVLKRLRPNLILSAHSHHASLISCRDCLHDNDWSWERQFQNLQFLDSYVHLNLNQSNSMHEIVVPTCSYRMGVSDMGFGLAIIGSEGVVDYTTLWLPRRYTMLIGYVIYMGISGAVLSVLFFSQRR